MNTSWCNFKVCYKVGKLILSYITFLLIFFPGKNYGLKQFKTELKAAMQLAGVENEQVFFILEDHNLITTEFLDMINR
jgi:hypothetical protein